MEDIGDLDDMMDDIEVTGEESLLNGDPPEGAGIECTLCGINIEVAWEERGSLKDRVVAHGLLCPVRNRV